MAEYEVVEGEIVEGDAPASSAMAIDPLTRAEIDMQVATAKRYPRDLVKFARNMMAMCTLDEETAASCYYSLPQRGGKTAGSSKIEGPSVRMAEIALNCFGNTRAGNRSLGETEDGRFVRELGFFHDVENNNIIAKEAQRRITTREGKRYGDDMVGVTRAAAGAIAFRNAVFAGIPRALIKKPYDAAKKVALGATKSLTERRAEILERLRKLSSVITTERVLAVVGKPSIEAIDWPDLETLIGMGTAIKDGQITVEAAFPDPALESPTASDILKPKGAASDNPASEPATGQATPPPAEGEKLTPEQVAKIRAQADKDGVSFEQVEEAFEGPLAEYSAPGRSRDDVFADALRVITRLVELKPATDALEELEKPGGGSLFDAPASATKGKK